MLRDENFYIQQQSSDITHEVKDMLPKFVGLPCHTNMLTGKGMPKHITNAESAVLLRVIKANTTFVLSEPVQAGKSLAVTLTDRQQLQHDDERYVRVILRALPSFHNKSGHDNVIFGCNTSHEICACYSPGFALFPQCHLSTHDK